MRSNLRDGMIRFLQHHRACASGYEWALENCNSMQEVWDKVENPSWLIWVATREGVLTGEERRRFCRFCLSQIEHLIDHPVPLKAMLVFKRYVETGEIDQNLLEYHWSAVWNYLDSLYTMDIAAQAVRHALWDENYSCSVSTARAVAPDGTEEYLAVRQAQASWLRENVKPDFNRSMAR